MSENSERLTIRLLIDNEIHYFVVPRSAEGTYRAAAERINKEFARYREHYKDLSLQKYNALVLTSLTVELLQEKKNTDTLPVLTSIEQLTSEIAETLGEVPSLENPKN